MELGKEDGITRAVQCLHEIVRDHPENESETSRDDEYQGLYHEIGAVGMIRYVKSSMQV